MTRPVIREKVRKLRSKGKTYSEIQKVLGISMPKSTLSNWCQNIILPDWYNAKIQLELEEIVKLLYIKIAGR